MGKPFYIIVHKEDVESVRYHANKYDYVVKSFPIRMYPRLRNLQITYIGRSALPDKMKNTRSFRDAIQHIRKYAK